MPEERKPPVMRDPRIPKFPVVFAEPTFAQVRDNINTDDLLQWAVLGAVSFPAGYMVGMQLDRKLARPAMLFTGVMSCIGGALLSYQNSEMRLKGFGRNDAEVARYLPAAETAAAKESGESSESAAAAQQ